MKRTLLSLLLACVCGGATAATPPGCVSTFRSDSTFVAAEAALAKARTHPGAHDLALAEALADMADAVDGRFLSDTLSRPKERPKPADLIAQAQAIWAAAPPDPELATQLWRRGWRERLEGQCALARAQLESALALADRMESGTGPLALSIARDLAHVAAALGDDPTLRTLSPRLSAALEGDTLALEQKRLDVYLAVAAYQYRTHDNARAEQLLRRLLDKAMLASPQDAALLRRLQFELASILYAQLRYKEAESLIAPLAQPSRTGPADHEAHKRLEADMARRVRGKDLAGAATLGQEGLARYTAERERLDATLAEALAAEQAAVAANRHAELPGAKTRVARARQELNVLVTRIADIQSNLGEVLHARGQLAAALALYEKALENYVARESTQLYRASLVRAAMGSLYRTRGDFTRALALQQEVQTALLPQLGKAHPDVIEAEAQIAALNLALQQPAKPAPPAPARPAKRGK